MLETAAGAHPVELVLCAGRRRSRLPALCARHRTGRRAPRCRCARPAAGGDGPRLGARRGARRWPITAPARAPRALAITYAPRLPSPLSPALHADGGGKRRAPPAGAGRRGRPRRPPLSGRGRGRHPPPPEDPIAPAGWCRCRTWCRSWRISASRVLEEVPTALEGGLGHIHDFLLDLDQGNRGRAGRPRGHDRGGHLRRARSAGGERRLQPVARRRRPCSRMRWCCCAHGSAICARPGSPMACRRWWTRSAARRTSRAA